MKTTRKDFLKTVGAGMLGAATLGTSQAFGEKSKMTEKLNLGITSYSFREFSLNEAIAMTQILGIKNMSLKSMHMPLENNLEQIKASAAKVRDAGIDLYGAGVIYMKSGDEVNKAFEYAKAADLRVIIGVPNHDLLPLVNEKVKEYDIIVAIHNHGPGDDLYPSPDDVYEKVQNFDNRMGLCLDIEHTFRIGQDPAQKARQYADRLYDVHFKDVDRVGKEGSTVECGRGVMDLPTFLETLLKIKYQGVVALEYEKDGDDPLPGTAESIGYARGVMDTLNK